MKTREEVMEHLERVLETVETARHPAIEREQMGLWSASSTGKPPLRLTQADIEDVVRLLKE